jgi:hypothetical protein
MLTTRNVRVPFTCASMYPFPLCVLNSTIMGCLDVGFRTATPIHVHNRMRSDGSSSSTSSAEPSPYRSSFETSRPLPGVPGVTTSLLGNTGGGHRASSLYPSAPRSRLSHDYTAPRHDFARAPSTYQQSTYGTSLSRTIVASSIHITDRRGQLTTLPGCNRGLRPR